jgi:hypothetical protein
VVHCSSVRIEFVSGYSGWQMLLFRSETALAKEPRRAVLQRLDCDCLRLDQRMNPVPYCVGVFPDNIDTVDRVRRRQAQTRWVCTHHDVDGL